MQDRDNNEFEDGFSSNQQLQGTETIPNVCNSKRGQAPSFVASLVLNKVQPPPEIKNKNYSLEPDLITGWAPKVFMPKPVRLIFENPPLQETIKIAIWGNIHKLCYLGPRFTTTYSAWKVLGVPFPYNYLNQQKIVLTDRLFSGMNPKYQQQSIRFDSLFESGNLDAVFKVQQYQYNCFMRVDANTRGHLQWYYFKINNLIPHQKYRLNIYNFQKAKTLYTRGMKPYIFSQKLYESNHIGWHQSGQNISYTKNPIILENESIFDKEGKFFKLSFTISTQFDKDTLKIAYCPPYTYTRLIQFLSGLMIKCIDRNIISQDYLCVSLGGLKLPLITITNEADEEQALFKKNTRYKGKKLIFVMGRVHPGECNGSYMVEGFIKWLCNHSPQSNQVRHRYVFKILPMANPDGVVIGNYRGGLSGKDFNREFINPDNQLFVEVYQLKNFLQKCKGIYGNDFNLFMDFHGHTVKKNVFTYGPQFSITDYRYYESKLLPKLIGRKTSLFRFHSCIFKIVPSKQSTARAVLLKQLKIPFAYTIQASNGCFYDHQELRDEPFNIESWIEVGEKIGQSIYDYWLLFKVLIKKKQERNKQKEMARIKKDRNKRIKSSVIRGHQYRQNGSQRHKSSLQNLKNKQNFNSEEILKEIYEEIANNESKQKCSDDQLSEGRSDSQSESNDLPLSNLNIIQIGQEEKHQLKKNYSNNSPPQKRSYVKILKSLKKNSIIDLEVIPFEKQKKMFQVTKQRTHIRKKMQSLSGTPSPVKESEANNTAKIINISFALNPIPTGVSNNIIDERYKKIKTESSEVKFENRRASKQDQYDSYRKTYLSLQREALKREDLKRKSYMNALSSNGGRKIQQIVGRRIFTETM